MLSQHLCIGQRQTFVDIILLLKKKTNELNIIAAELVPALPLTEVYYFRELNCNDVNLTWDYERVMRNLNALTVMVYQQLTTDIKGNPN